MAARQSVPAVTRRSYVALSNYNEAIYNYSYGLDEQLLREVGAVTLNPLATAQNCPKGAVLHETGKKLSPQEGNFRGANDGVTTYMVGVYDPVNGISGFIDPNSPVFGLQNTDKPIYIIDNNNLGNGILTNGTIETTQSVKAGTSIVAGTTLAAGTNVIAGTYISSKQINVPLYNSGGGAVPYNPLNTVADVFIDSTAANIFVITAPRGSAVTTIWINFSSDPAIPGNFSVVNGTVITLICVNGANRAVNIGFNYFNGPVVKTTSNTLTLPDGDPNSTMSNIMFTGANNYIIELNRSGVMAF